MQIKLDFKPLPKGFSFEPNKKYYANTEDRNTNKYIAFLIKRNAGLSGEITKLKKNMKTLTIIIFLALLSCKPAKKETTKPQLIDAIASGSRLTKADAG